jgi:hypothetical protein
LVPGSSLLAATRSVPVSLAGIRFGSSDPSLSVVTSSVSVSLACLRSVCGSPLSGYRLGSSRRESGSRSSRWYPVQFRVSLLVVTGLVPTSPTGFRLGLRSLSVVTGAVHSSVTGLRFGFRFLSLWLAVRVSVIFLTCSRLGFRFLFLWLMGRSPFSDRSPTWFRSSYYCSRFGSRALTDPRYGPVSLYTATSSGVVVSPPLLSR